MIGRVERILVNQGRTFSRNGVRVHLLWLFLMGCTGGDEMVHYEVVYSEHVSALAGVNIPVEISEESSSFLLDVASEGRVAVARLFDPDGELVLDYLELEPEHYLSHGFFPRSNHLSFNWPIRESDTPLRAGQWDVQLAVLDDAGLYLAGKDLGVTTQWKADSDLERGVLHVRVLFDQTVSGDLAVRSATESAVSVWQQHWAPYGLKIEVEYEASVQDINMPTPSDRTREYELLDGAGEAHQITVLIGHYIDDDLNQAGVTGSVPAALSSSPLGIVLVSWLSIAGVDGVFSPEEITLYGSVLAHESGHHLGLFHPVEMDWNTWDALSDTPDCTSVTDCEAQLGANFMFPYPLCDEVGCEVQSEMTEAQKGVCHRYTGTL